MMSWMKRRSAVAPEPVEVQLPPRPRRPSVPAEYLPLHKYLAGRFADTVVLRLTEIEDLLGSPLPAVARREQGWWTEADDAPAAPSRAWTQASRTAKPNLLASIVVFERVAVSRA